MVAPPDDVLAGLLKRTVNFLAREVANRVEDAVDNGAEVNVVETVYETVEEVLFLWLTNELNNPQE